MYTTNTRKISVIEEVLKVDNEETLKALEAVLKNAQEGSQRKKNKPATIYDFVGILTAKETTSIKKVIKETSEMIHPDDWK
ncbi:MAG: hypothetical protein J7599_19770 [Niabella sp.]|nr:hypothetical protein [Niabella sp.]